MVASTRDAGNATLKFAAALVLGAVVAACSTPADKITAALTDSGVSATRARCMGDRLQDKLSLAQLKRLGDLAKEQRGQGKISVNELAQRLDRDGDPKLVAAVVGAGLGCLY